MRSAVVTMDVENAWECWYVVIPDHAPHTSEELAEWMKDHPDEWEYFDLKDRGGDSNYDTIVVEDMLH